MHDDYHYLVDLAKRLGIRYEVVADTDERLAADFMIESGTLRVEFLPGTGDAKSLTVQ